MPDLLHATIGVSLEEQLEEAKREVKMRRSVYPRRVSISAMSQADADRRIARMEAIAKTLETLISAGAAVPELVRREIERQQRPGGVLS
ncbi:MAG TPA: hypothetical protein VGC34_09950 [Steroidobacteraceae bacterium]